MPVIVVGADTFSGRAIIDSLYDPDREIRAFVSDVDVAQELKASGIKVALGDVSDDSHVEAAATACFSAVLIAEAASDDRERAFATEPDGVLDGWARAVAASKVTRVIWVGLEPPEAEVAETAVVDPDDPELAEKVTALDDAASI